MVTVRRREFLRGLCTAAAAVAVPAVALGTAKAQLWSPVLHTTATEITLSDLRWRAGPFTLEDLRAAIATMRAAQKAPEFGYVVHVHPSSLNAVWGIGCEVITTEGSARCGMA